MAKLKTNLIYLLSQEQIIVIKQAANTAFGDDGSVITEN